MKTFAFYFIAPLLIVGFVAGALSQTPASPLPAIVPPPGNIQLLDGYIHEKRRGIDTDVGVIKRAGGLEIRYDIGPLAGNAAGTYAAAYKDKVLWYKGQIVNGDELWILALKDGFIMATFVKSDTNFSATAKTPEDVAEFLLTVMTFVPDREYIKKWEERKKLIRKASND